MNFYVQKTLALLVLISISSCREEPKFDQNKLIGHWQIREGLRGGKPSAAFDGAYFEFSADEKMTTNLPLPDPNFVEIACPFSLKKDIIFQKPNGAEGVDMKIIELTDSSLAVDFKMREVDFHLVFQKGEAVVKDSIPVGKPDTLETN